MDANDNGNGRITLAVLGQKMDEVLRRMDSFDRCQNEHDKRLNSLEQGAAKREQKLETLADDVDTLQNKDTFGALFASGLAAIAGIIAWFK